MPLHTNCKIQTKRGFILKQTLCLNLLWKFETLISHQTLSVGKSGDLHFSISNTTMKLLNCPKPQPPPNGLNAVTMLHSLIYFAQCKMQMLYPKGKKECSITFKPVCLELYTQISFYQFVYFVYFLY